MNVKILSWNRQENRDILKQCLQAEKLFIGSTDTVLGLFSPTTQRGVEQLNILKERSNKPYLILASDFNCIKNCVLRDNLFQIENTARRFWPGPLTIVFKARSDIPRYLTSLDGKIAFRVPKHTGIQDLLAGGQTVFSTSANLAGNPVPVSVKELDPQLLASVEYLVLDEPEQDIVALPSTIIEVGEDGSLKLIREGAIKFKEIELTNR